MSDFTDLPDRLLAESAFGPASTSDLLTEAAERICALEEELLKERRRAEPGCRICGTQLFQCGICGGHFCLRHLDRQQGLGLCPTCPDRESA